MPRYTRRDAGQGKPQDPLAPMLVTTITETRDCGRSATSAREILRSFSDLETA